MKASLSVLVLVSVVFFAGCATRPAAVPPTATAPVTALSVLPTTQPTPAAAPTRAPSPSPAGTKQATSDPTDLPTPTDFEQPPPPLGELSARDEQPVPGDLGSWCYYAGCLDSLPPPKDDLPLLEITSRRSELTFSMPETDKFVYWAASYGAESLEDGLPLADGGTQEDPDANMPRAIPQFDEATFPAPPPGDWVISVGIWFPDGIGDAHYYWHVTVPRARDK